MAALDKDIHAGVPDFKLVPEMEQLLEGLVLYGSKVPYLLYVSKPAVPGTTRRGRKYRPSINVRLEVGGRYLNTRLRICHNLFRYVELEEIPRILASGIYRGKELPPGQLGILTLRMML